MDDANLFCQLFESAGDVILGQGTHPHGRGAYKGCLAFHSPALGNSHAMEDWPGNGSAAARPFTCCQAMLQILSTPGLSGKLNETEHNHSLGSLLGLLHVSATDSVDLVTRRQCFLDLCNR